MDRGLTLRTYLWLAGSLFIVAASLSFLAYLIVPLPWWAMVVALGGLVGGVVIGLEHVLARPLERLTTLTTRMREGHTLPPPGGPLAMQEAQQMWKAMRAFQDQMSQGRHGQTALEGQLSLAQRQLHMLASASEALRPEVPLQTIAPELMKDLAAILGLQDVYLVPLRRHCPVPVLGAHGTPVWAEAVRATGLVPWEPVLMQDRPLSMCLTSLAPSWREHFQGSTLWVVPLNYHGRAQGLLLAPVSGTERTWTPDELALLEALSQVLAASLHPPRWSDERGPKPVSKTFVAEHAASIASAESAPDDLEGDFDADASRRRPRRARQGART